MNEQELYYQEPAPVPPKKGRVWPAFLVMAVMLTVGIVIYAVSLLTKPPVSETPWFSAEDGVLSFEQECYTDGLEMDVPEYVDGQRITAIGDSCFQSCVSFYDITLPDSVTHIGDRAFISCSNLQSIKLPDSVEWIGDKAFLGCSNLEAIRIPGITQHIGDSTFVGCSSLRHIFYEGTAEEWEQLSPENLPKNVTVYIVDSENPQGYSPYAP